MLDVQQYVVTSCDVHIILASKKRGVEVIISRSIVQKMRLSAEPMGCAKCDLALWGA